MLDNTKQNRFEGFFHAEEYLKMYLEADDQSNEDILVNSIVVRFVDGFTIRTSCRYCRSNWRIRYQRISISLHITFFR